MFKNPIKKYQSGGSAPSQEQQEMLAAFVQWLPTKVKEFENMEPEQIVETLNSLSKTPEGQKQIQSLMEQFQQEMQGGSNMFRKGGKLNAFICKHAKGGHVAGCGCKEDGGKVTMAQSGSGSAFDNFTMVQDTTRRNPDGSISRVKVIANPIGDAARQMITGRDTTSVGGYWIDGQFIPEGDVTFDNNELERGIKELEARPYYFGKGKDAGLDNGVYYFNQNKNTNPYRQLADGGDIPVGAGGLKVVGKALSKTGKTAGKASKVGKVGTTAQGVAKSSTGMFDRFFNTIADTRGFGSVPFNPTVASKLAPEIQDYYVNNKLFLPESDWALIADLSPEQQKTVIANELSSLNYKENPFLSGMPSTGGAPVSRFRLSDDVLSDDFYEGFLFRKNGGVIKGQNSIPGGMPTAYSYLSMPKKIDPKTRYSKWSQDRGGGGVATDYGEVVTDPNTGLSYRDVRNTSWNSAFGKLEQDYNREYVQNRAYKKALRSRIKPDVYYTTQPSDSLANAFNKNFGNWGSSIDGEWQNDGDPNIVKAYQNRLIY